MQRQYSRNIQQSRQLLATSLWWIQQFSVLQGVVAAAKTAFAMALPGVTTPLAPVIVGLVSFAVYTANDLADIEEDAINCPDKSSFVASQPEFVAGLAMAGISLAAGLALWAGGIVALGVTMIPLVASVLYSVPLTPSGRRLKDVYVVNTVLVALAWALTVSALPLALAEVAVGPLAVAVCLFFLVRSIVSVELFNARDITGDAATGVATIPVVLGLRRTQKVLAALDVLTVGLLVSLTTIPHATALAVFAIATVSISLTVTWLLNTVENVDWLCLVKDGEYLLLGAAALLIG